MHLLISLVIKWSFVNKVGWASCLAVFDTDQLKKGSRLRGDPLKWHTPSQKVKWADFFDEFKWKNQEDWLRIAIAIVCHSNGI